MGDWQESMGKQPQLLLNLYPVLYFLARLQSIKHVKFQTYPQLLLELVILHKWKMYLLLSKMTMSSEIVSLLMHIIINSDTGEDFG